MLLYNYVLSWVIRRAEPETGGWADGGEGGGHAAGYDRHAASYREDSTVTRHGQRLRVLKNRGTPDVS